MQYALNKTHYLFYSLLYYIADIVEATCFQF